MQKHLAIGRGVKILDQKIRGGGGFVEPPPASLRVNRLTRILPWLSRIGSFFICYY